MACPTFSEARLHTSADNRPPSVAQLLLHPSTGRPHLGRLSFTSGRHPQSAFVHAEYARLFARLFTLPRVIGPCVPRLAAHPCHDLPASCPLPAATTDLAVAGIRAASQRGAGALLTAWSIPREVTLSDFALTFFLCSRLRIPFPFFTTPPVTCHAKCGVIPPDRPASTTHRRDLFDTAPLALHQMACGASGKSLARHNAFTRVLVCAACKELGVTPQLHDKLHSDPESRRLVDAIVAAFHRRPEYLGLDATIAVPLLQSYLSAAASSAKSIFGQRAREKSGKHKGFSGDATGTKGFLAIVGNHLGGIGTADFWAWFDGAFAEAVLGDIRTGATGRSALRRKSLALQLAQASLMRATAEMVSRSALDSDPA